MTEEKKSTTAPEGNDPLSPFERKMVDGLVDLLYREYQREEARAAEETKKLAARMSDDASIREEVIDALVAKGIARPVAAARTNTLAKMLAEGRALGIV